MNSKDDESLISHLEALREALMRCLISLLIPLPFCLFLAPKVLNYFTKILIAENNITFNYFSLTEVFILQIKIALLIDFTLCLPYILKNLWDFILPALLDNEKKFIKSTVFLSSALFLAGALFCFFIIIPLIIKFAIGFKTDLIQPVFNISVVMNLCLWLILAFGLMFQVPVAVYSLIKWGIIDYKTISSLRPYVVIIILIIAAILTPPDIISQIMLFVPTYLLFEAGLLFSKIKQKKVEDYSD